MTELADVLDPVAEVRAHVRVEVGELQGLATFRGDAQLAAGALCDLNRLGSALLDRHPPEEGEVAVVLGAKGKAVDLDRVRAGREPRQLRGKALLRSGEADEPRCRVERDGVLVEDARVTGERPVGGVDERRLARRCERDGEEPGMVVDEIELVMPREAREDMLELDRHLADPGARRLVVDGLECCRRPGVTRGEERDVDACRRQAVRQQADDGLGPTVLRRRDRKPRRRDHPDAHQTPSPNCTLGVYREDPALNAAGLPSTRQRGREVPADS